MPTAERDLSQHDPLDDFERRDLTLLGETRRVYVAGTGPGVIVLSEMPGIHPHVTRFARWVRDAGFTVWLPHLFGDDGRPLSTLYTLGSITRACISREFRAFAANQSSPIINWLRALAAHAHPLCGGRGVGAIGMCFTGNFALSMMVEPAVRAPVLSQPSLPLREPAGLEIAPDELVAVRQRLGREDLTVLAYRFKGDRICRAERFAAYAAALGDRFIGRELPDEAANGDVSPFFARHVPYPHSVVTQHLIDEAGQPTIAARDEILTFFRTRLAPATGAV
jgi:dienelactone hydrolase